MNKSGQCMCGAVSFDIKNVDPEFGACHCKMCQRWAGSALLGFTVPPETITFRGLENVATFQSSDWAERGWCRKCGSGIWYRTTAEGSGKGTYHMPVGLLDDPSGMTLKREIFVDEKSPAFTFADETEKMTGAELFAKFSGNNEE